MASLITCKVHPVVLLAITDAYERRDSKDGSNSKAIGTLLGYHDKGSVELTNCYCVPHSEINDEAKISTQVNKEMYDLNRAANAVETAVGWFSTSSVINDTSLILHEFYQGFVKSVSGSTKEPTVPIVHLTVDTTLVDGRMGLRAYIMQTVKLPKTNTSICSIFVPIDLEIVAFEPEKVGIAAITPSDKEKSVQLLSGVQQIKKSTEQMLVWIEKLHKYIDDVIDKKQPGDVNMGRKLNELVTSVTQLQPSQFESMLNTGMKDFLMIAYLAELAKTELKLYEKLTSI